MLITFPYFGMFIKGTKISRPYVLNCFPVQGICNCYNPKLCRFYDFLLKSVYEVCFLFFFFFIKKMSKWIFGFFHLFSHREKTQKVPHIYHSQTYKCFAYAIVQFCLTNSAKIANSSSMVSFSAISGQSKIT